MKLPENLRRVVALDLETSTNVREVTRNSDEPIKAYSFVTETSVETGIYDKEKLESAILKYQLQGYVFLFHNAAFDIAVLRSHGHTTPVNSLGDIQYIDSMVTAYCLRPGETEYSLASLAHFVNDEKLQVDFDNISDDLLLQRCETDTIITYKLWKYLSARLTEDDVDYLMNVEFPYIEVIIELNGTGMYVDKQALSSLKVEFDAELEQASHELNSLAYVRGEYIRFKHNKVAMGYKAKSKLGGKEKPVFVSYGVDDDGKRVFECCEILPVNYNSGDQVADVMMKFEGWEPSAFSFKTAKPVVDSDTLTELATPISTSVLTCRKLSKLLSTYINPYLAYTEDRIYGQFRQTVTATRRLSSSKPNLQNIPVRSERGAKIRKLVTAPPGSTLVVGDLDRIEVVVLAYYLESILGASSLNDRVKIPGSDIHTLNSERWGVPRPHCKNGLFCWLYGGGVNRLSTTLKISLNEAKKIISAMEEDLPELFEFRDTIHSMSRSNSGLLFDMFGGRVWTPDITHKLSSFKSAAERQSVNYLIQGTAGVVFKILQIKASAVLWQLKQAHPDLSVRFVLAVHDEAVYEVNEEYADLVANAMTEVFTTNSLLTNGEVWSPVSATFHSGSNWLVAKGE